jgi:two-component system chemotaxis response regulator CheB
VENRHRPAIDVLFRSAARAYGCRVIGVILTGYLDDGTAGLLEIKAAGGTAIVQDPDDALVPNMPESAIANIDVDYVRPLAEIPELLVSLVNREIVEITPMVNKRTEADIGPEPKGTPSAYTCPQCNGTLWEVNDQGLLRFACRVGHAYSAESMAEDNAEAAERALWAALRSLEERGDLLNRLANRAEQRNAFLAMRRFRDQAKATAQNAEVLRGMLSNGKVVQERHDDKSESTEQAESA